MKLGRPGKVDARRGFEKQQHTIAPAVPIWLSLQERCSRIIRGIPCARIKMQSSSDHRLLVLDRHRPSTIGGVILHLNGPEPLQSGILNEIFFIHQHGLGQQHLSRHLLPDPAGAPCR